MSSRGRGRGPITMSKPNNRPKYIISEDGTIETQAQTSQTWTPSKTIAILKTLKFTDFEGSGWEFNLPSGAYLSYNEKIIIDNIWVVHKRTDLKHQIACLNALIYIFSQKKKYYVIYTRPTLGIYKDG
ncbi:hypothetical protein PanWU01x14_328400 [Parasponia andersonii]|uniref:Uncharacterized protein n=1 Tax=Parasponia andersonii TaxID=3476 RepID=A0A2P5AIP8_PARAD|nr:hypothetical protein PanWU01x14_328400 [Parasponia andersonii]